MAAAGNAAPPVGLLGQPQHDAHHEVFELFLVYNNRLLPVTDRPRARTPTLVSSFCPLPSTSSLHLFGCVLELK